MATSEEYRALGESAWSWVLDQVCGDDGPWLPEVVDEDDRQTVPAPDRDSLYAGIAGLVPVLSEVGQHRSWTGYEQALAHGIATRLATQARTRTEPSLYDGLAGDVTALRMLDPGSEAVALRRLVDLATPEGWETRVLEHRGIVTCLTDVTAGSAGIVMTAVWAGGEHAASIATTGGEALLEIADATDDGLDWPQLRGATSRMPNFSHGTAGVASALAVAGAALDRPDFVEAAVRGARHLLAIGTLDDTGFVVPHTIPPSTREVEPETWNWCHGPAGTSYLFAALAHAGVTEVAGYGVTDLRLRCLDAVLASGVPQRLRPGFWDNDGRCCGTAGVGEALLDAAQDSPDPARARALVDAARTMGDALVERAVVDADGARWRFVEHRRDPSLLPPGTSWMQGAAGIAAYLLRLSRVVDDGTAAPVVDRPDQWWAVPAGVRTVHVAGDALG